MHPFRFACALSLAAAFGLCVLPCTAAPGDGSRQARPHLPTRQVGKASIYAHKFAGRRMANGRRMDPADSNAASKTLPLGTTARVTNLENGKSTVVTIEDRGPHVPGRVVDLSPGSAAEIGVTRRQGVAPVVVEPIAVPPGPQRPVARQE